MLFEMLLMPLPYRPLPLRSSFGGGLLFLGGAAGFFDCALGGLLFFGGADIEFAGFIELLPVAPLFSAPGVVLVEGLFAELVELGGVNGRYPPFSGVDAAPAGLEPFAPAGVETRASFGEIAGA